VGAVLLTDVHFVQLI